MEKIKYKKSFAAAAIMGAGALLVAGCGPNYSGDGNEFKVEGQVTDPGDHSLKARIFQIDEAYGQAEDWFSLDHVHQLHDNCYCDGGFTQDMEKVGEVQSRKGDEISPQQVAIGSCVVFIGRIRASKSGKYSHDRPVYELARVEDCPKTLS